MGLKVKNITKKYDINTDIESTVVNNVSLEIQNKELIAIVGESGAGKSTLMHILGCIDKATAGEYYVDDISVDKMSDKELAAIRNSKFGFVLQDFGLMEDEKVIDNVMLPMMFSDIPVKNMKNKALESLKLIEMEKYAKRYVEDLSGGEKQRIAVARALVSNPDYIFADEPTGALDSKNSTELMNMLIKLNKKGKTIIIITHDMNIANMCQRIITIKDGKIISDKSTK